MRNRYLASAAVIGLGAGCMWAMFSPALAQTATAAQPAPGADANAGGIEEVIVTARKREESIQNVPVAINAFDKDFLDRQAFSNISQLANFTPGLQITSTTGGDGGAIVLRGIGTFNLSATMDQAVALNFDGVQVSTSGPLRLGTLDMQQVEVLRGPQALFFGKNSPGGVISFNSANPTDETEAMVRVGYETAELNRFVDGMISGQIADGLDARLAVHFSDQDGWLKLQSENLTAAQTGPYINSPTYALPFNRYPQGQEFDTRGSVKYDKGPFEALLKVTYSSLDGAGSNGQIEQLTYCPGGVQYWWYAPQPAVISNLGNCKPDNISGQGGTPPGILAHDPKLYGTNPGGNRNDKDLIGSLDLKYSLDEYGLTVESVSGWFNMWSNGGPGPYSPTAAANVFSGEIVDIGQGSEELRLSSNWSGPVNFVVGAFYDQSSNTSYLDPALILPGGGFLFPGQEQYTIEQKSYSGFGQVDWKIIPTVTLSAGVRWTHEEKDAANIVSNGVSLSGIAYNQLLFNNASPEVTLSYKPDSDLMFFVSYKQGFKAGGFDTGYGRATQLASDPTANFTFQPETIAGYEGGVKSTLMNDTLQLNLTGYTYKYSNLQLVSLVPPFSFFTTNAGGSDISGIEAEAIWKPPSVSGLTIHGSGSYNHTEYTKFISQCWPGQTISEGCNQAFDSGTGAYTSQSLAGRPLAFAPEFSATLDLDYETTVGHVAGLGDLVFGIDSNTTYSSNYYADDPEEPSSLQSAYVKSDLSLRLSRADDFWEFEVLCRNMFNKYTLVETHSASFSGGGTGTTSGQLADEEGQVSEGRTFLIQLTIRPTL